MIPAACNANKYREIVRTALLHSRSPFGLHLDIGALSQTVMMYPSFKYMQESACDSPGR